MNVGVRAYETEIEFSGRTGKDIVVDYGKPNRLVLWSRAQYVPCWDMGGNVWLFNEWFETGSIENRHCYEPIMDMENRYIKADIVTEGPARTIVHWKYALCDSQYRIFNGNTTADEYYITYPDGTTIRKLVGWPGNESGFGGNPTYWEVGEWDVINGSGIRPEDVIDSPVLTLMNLLGDSVRISWPSPYTGLTVLCEKFPQISGWQEYIGIINLKDRPMAYAVIPRNAALFPHETCSYCGKYHPEFHLFGRPNTFDHWPDYNRDDWVGFREAGSETGKGITVTAIASYGYAYNRRRKCADPEGTIGNFRNVRPPRPTTWVSLVGVTDRDEDSLLKVVSSWLKPADVTSSWVYDGYSYSQKAYVFRPAGKDKYNFNCLLAPVNIVVNPVLILEGVAGEVMGIEINGEKTDAYEYQEENNNTVIWIDRTFYRKTEIRILLKY